MSDTSFYCHSCHKEWQQQQQTDAYDCPACPACGSASTEIVREFIPSVETGVPLTGLQITPENDPRHFHARQPTEAVQPQPSATTTPSTNQGQETSGASATAHGSQPQHPGNGAEGTQGSQNPGSAPRPEFVFMFPQVTFFTTTVTDHVPPPNAAGPSGPPVTYFGLNFFTAPQPHAVPMAPPPTQTNSPPAGVDGATHQDRQSGEPQPHYGHTHHHHGGHAASGPTPVAMQLPFLGFLLSSLLNPANAVFGDAVYSQEALDRIISQFREANGPGGAPPASQEAIDKLEVRELDEAMIGGDGAKTTRCVICVDEMAVGAKASVLPCNHFFHGECVVPWLKQHNTCPVCRRPVEGEPVKPAKAAAFTEEQTAQPVPDTTGCS